MSKRGISVKKIYAKPTLLKASKLEAIVATVVSR
jgi:hypothetical protein